MGITDKFIEAMQGMMTLDTEVKQLAKRVERIDDILMSHAQRITRIETFAEIAEKQKKISK